jgi:signal transduction histidine kinase
MDKPLGYVYASILVLNLAIVSLFSLVMYQTTFLVCDADQARNFLEQARYLPHVPWHVPVYAISSFLLLTCSGLVKRRISESQPVLTFMLFLLDIALTFFIAYNLNFSYKGLFLFLGVGAFFFIANLPLRYLAIALVMLGYIFSDFDIISVRWNLVSLQDYIGFYGTSAQIPLYSIRSTLESLNLMMVILFFQFLIQSKIRENKEFIKVNNELSDKLHQLEILQGKLEESARLKERNRLAHEIHDILGHSLTSISTGLEACIELSRTATGELHRRLVKIKSVTDKGLTDIRRSVRELKSDAIEKSSLLSAVQDLINDANALGDRSVGFIIIGNAVGMEDDEEQTVYRLVQESLTNSFKHSASKKIDVTLHYTKQQLSVIIADDGKGCAKVVKHFGLEHIEEQIALLGGKVHFDTGENQGFRTFATIPLRKGGQHS